MVMLMFTRIEQIDFKYKFDQYLTKLLKCNLVSNEPIMESSKKVPKIFTVYLLLLIMIVRLEAIDLYHDR